MYPIATRQKLIGIFCLRKFKKQADFTRDKKNSQQSRSTSSVTLNFPLQQIKTPHWQKPCRRGVLEKETAPCLIFACHHTAQTPTPNVPTTAQTLELEPELELVPPLSPQYRIELVTSAGQTIQSLTGLAACSSRNGFPARFAPACRQSRRR